MHIASIINPLTKSTSDVPIIVLTLSDSDNRIISRKFVARPRRYADLISTTRHTFKILPGARPIFRTMTLDVCRGHLVEIDESAYATMANFLDEVNVILEVEGIEERAATPMEDIGDTTEVRDDAPAPALTAKRLGKTRQIDAGESFTDRNKAQEHADRGEDVRVVAQVESEPQDAPPAPPATKVPSRSKPKLYHAPPIVPLESRPPKAPKPQRKPEPEPQPTEKQSFEEELFEELEREREILDEGAGSKSREPDQDDDFWRFGAEDPRPGQASTSTVNNKDRDAEAEAKTHGKARSKAESLRARLSAIDVAQLPGASSRPSLSGGAATTNKAQDDGRFNIVIHCFHGEESSVEFKTRGKYLVRKVLASACKTFEVDYDRSGLILVVEEDDGTETMYFCNPDETMEECGVLPDSRLLLEVEDRDIDEDSEAEEEEEDED